MTIMTVMANTRDISFSQNFYFNFRINVNNINFRLVKNSKIFITERRRVEYFAFGFPGVTNHAVDSYRLSDNNNFLVYLGIVVLRAAPSRNGCRDPE